MGRVSAGHYVIGMEGLALLRSWLTGDRAQADARVRELAGFITAPRQVPLSIELDAPETDVATGYARWAGNYDTSPNGLIHLEQPVVHGLIDRIPVGVALDAACGTGRHTRYLHARGHRVIGIDSSAEMLATARRELPQVDLRTGDLLALPIETGSVDLVVCALALTHCSTLGPPVAELARVLRPGGRMILSDLHPMISAIGGTAFFVAADGSAAYVRSYFHLHSAYLAAFQNAGLEVRQCIEPAVDESGAVLMSGGMMDLAADAFRDALVGIPGALVWELSRCWATMRYRGGAGGI
jgi:SAM-dependent methyltransferase